MVLRGLNHTRMGSGVRFPERDFTMIPVAKNASSSILVSIWGSDLPYENGHWCDQITTSSALVMWRDPTKRAWSAYNMLIRRGPAIPSQGHEPWWPDYTLEWDEWLDALVKDRYMQCLSATLVPQSEYLCSPVRYEYFAWNFKALGERLGLELPHLNKMKKSVEMPDITPEMQYNLQILYGADYRIWELIT